MKPFLDRLNSKDAVESFTNSQTRMRTNIPTSTTIQKPKVVQPIQKPSYSLKPFFFGGNAEIMDSIKYDHIAHDKKIIAQIKPQNLNKDFASLKDDGFKTQLNHDDFIRFSKRQRILQEIPQRKSKSVYTSIRELQNKNYDYKEEKPAYHFDIEEVEKKLSELTIISEVTNKYMEQQKKNSFKLKEGQTVFLKETSSTFKNIDTSSYWQKKFNKNTEIHQKILNMQMNRSKSEAHTPINNEGSLINQNLSFQGREEIIVEQVFKKMRQVKELSNDLQVGEIHALKLLYKQVLDQIDAIKLYDSDSIKDKLNTFQVKMDQESDTMKKDILLYSALKFVTLLSQVSNPETTDNKQFSIIYSIHIDQIQSAVQEIFKHISKIVDNLKSKI